MLTILMLFVAPVISKSLESLRASQSSSATIVSMHADMSEMSTIHYDIHTIEHVSDSGCTIPQSISHHFVLNSSRSPIVDIPCGYCHLLIHLPLIQNVFIPFIWLILLISQVHFLPVIVLPLLFVCYPDCQPRAPPSMFSLC
ncbi:DUF2946 domain-containing protein [Yersinia intermedia]|uniref:DUF2946 domain-containing protein n=1 Tax=Yersinia intermedia TaxID=631 RepID=UPI00093FC191